MAQVSTKPLWLTAGLAFGISVMSTLLVEFYVHERIAIIGDLVGLQRSYNDGVAFGIELGFLQPILIAAALVVICWMALSQKHSGTMQIVFGLIIGGGFANVVDRFFDGKVTDVFQIGSFPVFNVADSAITVGVALLLFDMLFPDST